MVIVNLAKDDRCRQSITDPRAFRENPSKFGWFQDQFFGHVQGAAQAKIPGGTSHVTAQSSVSILRARSGGA